MTRPGRERGFVVRRLAMVSAILVATLVVATPAQASPLIETFDADFTLSSATCSNLPSGTTLEGFGTGISVTTERISASGVTTIMNSTHIHGTSTDQAGNVYVFNYSNSFRVSNTIANPGVFSGMMTDHFSNSGSGPAKLNNGFVANVQLAPTFVVVPISSFGDPLSFPDGAPHCDPL
jgi:hypothetical protein